MNLRIISGLFGGRFLRLKAGASRLRPTSERVRESVAAALAPRIQGARVADLCAGTGAFGFELLSRGASFVDFVESDRARIKALRRHVEEFGAHDQCAVHGMDVRRFLRAAPADYTIVFYDPPYGDDQLASVVSDALGRVADGGMLVYEHAASRDLRAVCAIPDACTVSSRRYGDTTVSFMTRASG
ncbi:MAG: methyltransferase [Chitinivibrionales bacterium]|nr:methyltransferase [Chitinivibrionales bacterium]MBD3394779.1 methyltransferase [Chitinivibrionales bacterium]